MLNIVVVEDNDDLREAIVAALRAEGHHATGLDSAEAVVEELGSGPVDLMLVDLNLPGEDGISLAARVRRIQPEVGIIMITARGSTADKTVGYESGADIYLTKPVALEELRAAIQALARRLKAQWEPAEIEVDVAALVLTGPAGAARLTPQETALLAALLRAPQHRLETWQVIDLLGRSWERANKNGVEVMIFRLRRKLQQVGARERSIRAIRSWGYQLCEDLTLR